MPVRQLTIDSRRDVPQSVVPIGPAFANLGGLHFPHWHCPPCLLREHAQIGFDWKGRVAGRFQTTSSRSHCTNKCLRESSQMLLSHDLACLGTTTQGEVGLQMPLAQMGLVVTLEWPDRTSD